MKIKLQDKKGFKWYSNGGIYVKGFIYDQSGKYYQGAQLLDFFSNITRPQLFKEVIQKLNGLFSIVIETPQGFYAAVDLSRTFPLFYCVNNDDIRISDTPGELTQKQLNESRIPEFLACGYVTGKETLLKGVYQIQAGSFLVVHQGQFEEQRYFYYLDEESNTTGSEYQIQDALNGIINTIGHKLVASLQGRQAVLPLSGGFDSRLIATLLKEQKYENVICFTFGRAANSESKIARIVAGKLDYPWYFIKNDKETVRDYFKSKMFNAYYGYASCFTSMFFMEQYFALLYLTKNNLIESNAVFIPGHSGDFFAGSHLKGFFTDHTSGAALVNRIFKKNYSLYPLSLDEKQKIIVQISKYVNDRHGPPHSIYEEWILTERQAKFIVNSARLYSFFNYEFRMPLWDKQFITFFKALPLKYKNYKILYNKLLQDRYFTNYKLTFNRETTKLNQGIKIQNIKSNLRGLLPGRIKQYYLNKNDTSGYREISREMMEEMHINQFDYYRKPDRNYNSVLIQWYLFKIIQEIKSDFV